MRTSPSQRLLAALLLPGLAAAAVERSPGATDPAPETDRPPPRPLEEVVVTARRRAETLEHVPIAVSSLPGLELEERQVYAMDDLGTVVPNMQFDKAAPSSGSSSVGTIFIRGIGQSDYTPVTDPGVALYVDGVYIGRSPGNVLDLVDIDRIEVLRGPQGTLFGRNSIGGAIKVHSARPSPEAFWNRLKLRIGNDDLAEATFKSNLPLGDDAAAGVAVNRIRRDGYVTRRFDGVDTGDRDRWSARGALDWDLTDDLAAFLVLDHAEVDENGAPIVGGGVNPSQAFATFGNAVLESCRAVRVNPGFDGTPASGPPTFPPPGAAPGRAPGCYGADTVAGPFVSEGTFPVTSQLTSSGAALQFDWSLADDFGLKSTTGWRSMRMRSSRDGDSTPANIFATRDDYDHEQFSQELQLEFTRLDGRLSALLGLFYFEESGFNLVDVTLPTGAIRSGGFYDNESWALFAHTTWELTDRLALSLGGRYTEDTKGYLPDQFALGDASAGSAPGFFPPTWPLLAGSYLAPTGPLAAGERIIDFRRSQVRFDNTDVLLDLGYRFTDRILAYASYASGYKSGGFDQRFVGPTADRLPTSYLPETVESFELGLKAYWPRRALRINLALFDADYEELQIIVRESFNPLTFNAGDARVRGGEVEVSWVPTPAWDFQLALGHIDAAYRRLNAAARNSGVRLTNALVNAPEWSFSAGARYRVDFTGLGSLTARLDWSWQDQQFNDAVNSEEIRQPSYSLVNASLAWAPPSARWRVALASRNLLDETYLVTGNSAFATPAAYVEQVFGRPRELLLSFDYEF